MNNKYLLAFLACSVLFASVSTAQVSLGGIQDNTNEALPESYNFKEYVFSTIDDQGDCTGMTNATATIQEVFTAQTHRHEISHPLFFTIGYRPFLLQVAVAGEGAAPDVQVEGFKNGTSIGTLCLAGPSELSTEVDLNDANFQDYFSVTIPKEWVEDGLELTITTGSDTREITEEELKVGPYTEMNLVMVNMDVMDYNVDAHQWPIFDRFLQEMASSIPASVIRFGIFPETLEFPEVVANNDTETLVRLSSRSALGANGIFDEGSINSIAVLFAQNLHRSTEDYLSTVYFGNTLNLAPGGWGGGKSFVGFDYTEIFIHELGHALSLPHWGQGSFDNPAPLEWDFLYPYGGSTDDGGGRGQSWNFIQDLYEFVSPVCADMENDNFGIERSDAMYRSNACIEQRNSGQGPWDGFSDFSALAIHRYLIGADVEIGVVQDGLATKNYQFSRQGGFPVMTLEGGERIYTRDPLQAQQTSFEEEIDLPGEEQLNQDVYLIYGTAHETQEQANIVYKPVKFNGTLPPIIDPTDPVTFAALQGDEDLVPYMYGTRDITLKMTYTDGSVLHALNPYQSYSRAPYTWTYNIWRDDVCNFALVVPADKELLKVELFNRPFCIRYDDEDTAGNINYAPNNITASTFMDDAIFQAEYVFGGPKVLGSNTIGNRVWHDLNQNGLIDNDEDGIADVSLILWEDGDGDDIPDWMGFRGVTKTDSEGYYSFGGLGPGNYLAFVWSVDNWEDGQPLHGMVPTPIFVEDPNTDVDADNNGRPGNIAWGLTDVDIASGMITLTADGEPLMDGDREDSWFDYDPGGNMTIDFGFFVEGAIVTNQETNLPSIDIYPNPATDQLTIKSEIAIVDRLTILNVFGQVLIDNENFDTMQSIDIQNLTTGSYICTLQVGEQILYKKLLVQK